MKTDKDIEALKAGTSEEGHPWLDSTFDVLTYDDYMSILSMIVDGMKRDLKKVNKQKFESDMQDIIRQVTKQPKHRRPEIKPEDIKTPNIKLKEIQTGERISLDIDLDHLRKVQMFDNRIALVTDRQFVNLIPRGDYQSAVEMMSEDEVKSVMSRNHIQYILYSYAKTVASMKKIILYAAGEGILEDNQSTPAETVEALSTYIMGKRDKEEHRNNVLNFKPSGEGDGK